MLELAWRMKMEMPCLDRAGIDTTSDTWYCKWRTEMDEDA
jgi:hypothetical protein